MHIRRGRQCAAGCLGFVLTKITPIFKKCVQRCVNCNGNASSSIGSGAKRNECMLRANIIKARESEGTDSDNGKNGIRMMKEVDGHRPAFAHPQNHRNTVLHNWPSQADDCCIGKPVPKNSRRDKPVLRSQMCTLPISSLGVAGANRS